MLAIDHVIGCGLVRCDIHRCDRVPKVLAGRQVPVFSDLKRYDRGNTRILRRYDSANGLVHIRHIRGRDQIRIRVCEGFDLRFVVLGRLARVHLIGLCTSVAPRSDGSANNDRQPVLLCDAHPIKHLDCRAVCGAK